MGRGRDEEEFAGWRSEEGDRASWRAAVESCDARSQIDGQRDKTVSVGGARLH